MLGVVVKHGRNERKEGTLKYIFYVTVYCVSYHPEAVISLLLCIWFQWNDTVFALLALLSNYRAFYPIVGKLTVPHTFRQMQPAEEAMSNWLEWFCFSHVLCWRQKVGCHISWPGATNDDRYNKMTCPYITWPRTEYRMASNHVLQLDLCEKVRDGFGEPLPRSCRFHWRLLFNRKTRKVDMLESMGDHEGNTYYFYAGNFALAPFLPTR